MTLTKFRCALIVLKIHEREISEMFKISAERLIKDIRSGRMHPHGLIHEDLAVGFDAKRLARRHITDHDLNGFGFLSSAGLLKIYPLFEAILPSRPTKRPRPARGLKITPPK